MVTDHETRDAETVNYYETLQISSNAEPETIHRVYRLLAQRYHPDNQETGSTARFRELQEAYSVLSDPEKRAQYDLSYHARKGTRWRVVSAPPRAENDFELENLARLSVLEVLYAHRRAEPGSAGVFLLDLEELTGTAREHLEFTLWYLGQKRYVQRADGSRLTITAEGIDYLEQHYHAHLKHRRLAAGSTAA
jgi:curved DNA-binding protein CbpA